MRIEFGTEGWRDVMGGGFTIERVQAVTQAAADHLIAATGTDEPVVLGYDNRFMADTYAQRIAEVLAGNGLRVLLTKTPVPTPALTRYVFDESLPMGIMVTASHNPAIYNGMKIKEAFGGTGSRETIADIENRIGKQAPRIEPFRDAAAAKRIETIDIMPGYLKALRGFVNLPLVRRAKVKLVVDSMHGTGGRLFERLLKGGKVKVQTLRAERDPLFGGAAPEPIAANLKGLSAAVRKSRADLGLANDGDADRLGIIAPGGRWLNPGQVLCLLLEHFVQNRRGEGGVVKTVSNTMMIDRLTARLGIPLTEVPVGFRFVAERMRDGDVLIGGEESGGIGIKGYMPERDGILIGLLTLEAIAASGKSLPELLRSLERRCGKWCYGRRDLRLKDGQVERLFARLEQDPPASMAGIAVERVNRLDGVKLIGADGSWMLFRRSGTEPLARVYAETPVAANLEPMLEFGVTLTQ